MPADVIPLDEPDSTQNLPDVIPLDEADKYMKASGAAAAKPAKPAEPKESIARILAKMPFESLMPPFMRGSGMGKAITEGGAASVLPTIGGIGGTTLGAMSPVPGGAVMGEMGGSAGGEYLNQLLGITEPSKMQTALAGVAPLAGRAVSPILRGTGTAIAKTLGGRDILSDTAKAFLNRWLSPTPGSAELFAKADQLKMDIPANETFKVMDDVLTSEMKRAPTAIRDEITEAIGPLKRHFQPTTTTTVVPGATAAPAPIVMGQSGVRGMARPAPTPASTITKTTPKTISAADMIEEEQRLRIMASRAYATDNTKLARVLNRARGAMLTDLEKSGAGVVSEASAAYRKEKALEDLGILLSKPRPEQKLVEFIKDNPLFAGAFKPHEMEQIMRIAKKLNMVTPSGGSGVHGRGLLGYLGFEVGGLPGLAAGALSGDMIRAVMEHPWGRNVVERLLTGRSTLDHPTAAAIATFARGMMANKPQPEIQE